MKQTETFCHTILGLKVGRSKALANLVMALASNTGIGSVTALSESPVYHYQYSSIRDSIDAFWNAEEYADEVTLAAARTQWREELIRMKSPYFEKPFKDFYLLNTDTTPNIRRYSPTLEDRSYVHSSNNVVKSNRPVDIGYNYSVIGLSLRRPLYHAAEPPWNLPLSTRRIKTNEVCTRVTAEQVNELLSIADTPLYNQLVVNTLDSNYATPEYIVDTYDNDNLVNIIRFANNRNTWHQLSESEQESRRVSNDDSRGADAIYGEKYNLRAVEDWDVAPDDMEVLGTKLSNGRQVLVELQVWDNRLIRTKRGKNMKDKPMRLLRIRLLDVETGEAIYKRPMWLSVWGKQKMKLTLEQIYWAYRNRFDIEHFFRFGKQRLLMQNFQPPDVEHLDNWIEIVSLAYCLLYAAQSEAQPCVPKWQKYDKRFKNRVKYDLPASPSEVQNQLESIILQFEQAPFRPNLKIKSKGRQEGEKQPKRERHKVVYKGKKRKKKKKNAA